VNHSFVSAQFFVPLRSTKRISIAIGASLQRAVFRGEENQDSRNQKMQIILMNL